MKKTLPCILLLLCTFVTHAAELTENFTTLSKSKYGTSSAATLSLPSGDWQALKMELKENSGVKQFTFSNGTSSYLITPAVDNPGKVSVDWGSGGNNKLTISYSVNEGAWQQLAEISSGGSGAKTYSAKTGFDEETNVRFRFVGSSSNTYVSKVVVKSIVTEPEPENDPTYITEGAWVPTKEFPAAVKTVYVSPDGNDKTGDGSIDRPWFNLQIAINRAEPGTHIVCRGGVYIQPVQSDGKFTVRINNSGTADNPIIIRCYDGERPVFDFRDALTSDHIGERGILITGDNWWLFGLHVTHAADNGIKIEGSHNRIERCGFSYNFDTGLQLGFGHNFSESFPGVSQNDGTYCAYNDIIDCDSYYNCDYDDNYGSDADGFACKMHNGIGNRFIRCRAWHNSDDAWDCYETDYSVVLAECWAWESGKKDDHIWVKEYITKSSSMSFSGNGNGIKLGGNGEGGSSKGIHYAFNCIAFGNNTSTSVKGFDCNSHKDGHVLVGCLGFDNSYDYMFESGGSDANTKYYNNVCLGKQEIRVGYDNYNAITSPMSNNGWSNNLVTGISFDDYLSLDEDDALMPRDIYGGLPRKFGRLAADSKMIDAGNASYEEAMPVWKKLVEDFPFLQRNVTGSARDLGPYERPGTSATGIDNCGAEVTCKQLTPRKLCKNGHVVIVRNGIDYNTVGQKL